MAREGSLRVRVYDCSDGSEEWPCAGGALGGRRSRAPVS